MGTPQSGNLALTGVKGSLILNGRAAVEAKELSHWAEPLKLGDVPLTKGDHLAIKLEGVSGIPQSADLLEAVDRRSGPGLAGTADADVIVAVVGLTSDLEGEEMPVKVGGFAGGDKTTLGLPADQHELLAKAKALGKPLIIVAMNGSAIDLSWAKGNAAKMLEVWRPRQSGRLAVGNVLSGYTNPSGPFYKSVADLPPVTDYNMATIPIAISRGRRSIRSGIT